MGDLVRLGVEDAVGVIRLDRPPMNAINQDVVRELQEIVTDLSLREDVRAAVIHGGEKVFAAGADVEMMVDMTPQAATPMIAALQEVYNQFEELPIPTIAAVTGYCLGGGLELAMCADFRIAAENARLGQPEIMLGIIPGAGGTQRLPRLVGLARAKDMIYSGRHVRADEAIQIGLVHEVVPSGDVLARARELAKKFANGPTKALRAAKVALNWGARGGDVREGIVLEREVFAGLFSTEDQTTGMRTFLERGPGRAEFSGK
jgi:enoyl-CoA hydratase/carnithine racemase